MAFDVQGARDAGYSEQEIADYLSTERKFDAAGARKAGYGDGEIIDHLSKLPAPAAPPRAAAPAPRKPSVLDGAPTAPLAGGGGTDLGSRVLALGDQLTRTYGGAAGDLADAAAGLINRPVNSVLKAAGVDYQLPTDQVGGRVAQPVGLPSQASRAIAPFLFGAGGTARALEAAAPRAVEAITGATRGQAAAAEASAALKAAPRVATPIATGVAAGAPVDAAMSSKSDKNLSNLVADMGGPQLPTARVAGENPGIAAVKDMIEGGVLGATVEKVLGFFTHGPRARPGTPEAAAEEAGVEEAMLDPRVKAQLDASGVAQESPRYQEFSQRIQARQAAEAAAQNPQGAVAPGEDLAARVQALQGAPNMHGEVAPVADGGTIPVRTTTGPAGEPVQVFDKYAAKAAVNAEVKGADPVSRLREITDAIVRGDVDPAALALPERKAAPEVVVVDSAGRADTGDLGIRTGADLRKPSNLPVPVATPTPRMSDAEIAQAQRAAEAGKANPVPEGETLHTPQDRAPQTRDNVAGQREAGQAFDLADRQRARVAGDVRDTQAAGLPKGPEPQRVLMDEGFPVKVVEDQGRGRVKVQRYDPRTGEIDPEAVPYDTHMAGLSAKNYTPEPRQAQDFGARDNPARMSPEEPRTAAQPVAREPTQTYRATPDVPPADGGPRFPDQAEGPMPGPSAPSGEHAQRAANEEELRARYEQARADQQYQDFSSRARESYKGQEAKGSPVAAEKDAESRFPTDEFGFVKSDKGGPVRFGDQKQAAKWILNVGHKESPDQIFEIANGPKGGFTVRETGRGGPPAEAGAKVEPEAPKGPAPGGRGEAQRPPPQSDAAPAAPPAGKAPPEAPAAGAPKDDGFRQMADGFAKRHDAAERVRAPGFAEPHEAAAARAGEMNDDELTAAIGASGKAREDLAAAHGVDYKTWTAQQDRVRRAHNTLTDEEMRRTRARIKEIDDRIDARAQPKAEMSDEQVKDLYKKHFGPGRKLYSNPLDPEAIHEELVKPAIEGMKKGVKALLNSTALSSARNAVEAGRRVMNEGILPVADAVRNYGGKYKNAGKEDASNAIHEMADLMSTDPGSGKAGPEPLDYAALRQGNARFKPMSNVLSDWKKAGATSEDIRRAMTGGRVKFDERHLVPRLRRMLDQHLQYLRDAGLDVGEAKNFFPRDPDATLVAKEPDRFVDAAERVYRAEGAADPRAAAEAWKDEVLTRGALHVSRTPGATLTTKSTRERVFKTAAADRELAPFMQDAEASLANYMARTSRQAEFARRFGPKGEKLDALFDRMHKGGVIPDDLNHVRHLADTGLGLLPGTKPTPVGTASGWVATIYTMHTLARTLFSQITEPLVVGVTTGDWREGAKSFGEYFSPIWEKGRLNRAELRERYELLGVVKDIMQDGIQLNRYGFEGQEAQKQGNLLTKFFRATGVTQITDFQTISAAKIGENRLRTLLGRMGADNNAPTLRALAQEFGLDEQAAKSVHAWTQKYGDRPPPVSDTLGGSKEGDKYAAAVYRFATQNVQNPHPVDKAAAASDPHYRQAYAITGFLYAFSRKVLGKMYRDVAHAATAEDYTLSQRAAGVIGPAFAYGLYMYASGLTWKLRQKVTNPEGYAQLTGGQKMANVLSANQAAGVAQPWIDLYMGVTGRYGRDFSSAYAGPYMTNALGDVANMVKGIQGGSEKTNTTEWNGTRAAYRAGAASVMMRYLTELSADLTPGGVLTRAGVFAAMQVVAAPQTSRLVADKIAGEHKPRPPPKTHASDVGSSDPEIDAMFNKSDDVGSSGEN